MKLKSLFKYKPKEIIPTISKILNADESDHPNLVYLASVIVSEYGAVLDETSNLTLGVSEKRLPYRKEEIQAAIELLLKFLNNKDSWGKLKQKYPKIATEIITDRYYDALRAGYIELAKFVPDNEAGVCEKASGLLNKPENLGKTIYEIIDELRLSWFEEVIQINKRISEDSSLRFKRLQDNFREKDILFEISDT